MVTEPFIRRKPTGCSGKCPCNGNWINCSYYIDKQTQEWRLKHKMLNSEILEYYQQHFSGVWSMHDLYVSG